MDHAIECDSCGKDHRSAVLYKRPLGRGRRCWCRSCGSCIDAPRIASPGHSLLSWTESSQARPGLLGLSQAITGLPTTQLDVVSPSGRLWLQPRMARSTRADGHGSAPGSTRDMPMPPSPPSTIAKRPADRQTHKAMGEAPTRHISGICIPCLVSSMWLEA